MQGCQPWWWSQTNHAHTKIANVRAPKLPLFSKNVFENKVVYSCSEENCWRRRWTSLTGKTRLTSAQQPRQKQTSKSSLPARLQHFTKRCVIDLHDFLVNMIREWLYSSNVHGRFWQHSHTELSAYYFPKGCCTGKLETFCSHSASLV